MTSIGLAALWAAPAPAGTTTSDTLGKTTVEQRILPNSDATYRELSLGAGEGYVVREGAAAGTIGTDDDGDLGVALTGREDRRTSLFYFGQLTDFQLADEESPSRVELIDTGPFSAALRPSEAMNPHIDDAMVRQVNAFAAASPLEAGDGSRRAMDLTIGTGDLADSQQLNETEWVRTLLEGGELDPNSGINTPIGYAGIGCLPGVTDEGATRKYTGVQDYNDFGTTPGIYDPDQPTGPYADWPDYGEVLDRAQQTFTAAGLDVPSYVAFGNHDGLVQGNAAANASYEAVATGCIKPASNVVFDPGTLSSALGALDPANLLSLDPTKIRLVPPDPKRQYVSKLQYKNVFRAGTQVDGHGFDLVDAAEETASAGAAGYYSWNPEPGIRFIGLDTVSEAGIIGPSADGNIDDPQFDWLRGELEDATAADELVVLFSHHAIPSLTADFPDEDAPPCTVADPHGHDLNPGCDLDPRDSAPIHLAADLTALLHEFPNAIAWVAGHSHVNSIEPYPSPSGEGGFWSIRVAAEADWPQQTRLMEIFDNDDGTLSIFGTIVDHASPATAPPSGADGSTFSVDDLASAGRTIAYNDLQAGGRACGGGPCGEGGPNDRNVELIVADPREDGGGGEDCETLINGTPDADDLTGTPASERIRGKRGNDRLSGLGGADCINGGRGRDRVNGGEGEDGLRGGGGNDRINARDGEHDVVRCGTGRHDRAKGDELDEFVNCERIKRPD
ncbi:MAG: hypothetical protein QOI31_1548 [Solirubrobacterales bacterium]|jgi:metallophosphoesterase (TIGR03767 family)|nr:hypothetical protein [Solirubrobacterales bacterium]